MNILNQGREWQRVYQAVALELAGDPAADTALAASKKIGALCDEIERLRAEVIEYRNKHEIACSTLELVKTERNSAQRALAAECKEVKRLRAEIERVRAGSTSTRP